MCQPGQRRELRRLVEHRVAGQQRRHEHVAADEVRVVPGRDVGDDAERLVARCARSMPPSSSNTVSSARRRARPRRGRSRCGRAGRSARCATARWACRSRRQGRGQRLELGRTTRGAEARDAIALRSASGVAAHAGCAARARAAFAATLAASSAGSSAMRRAGGGVDDLQRASCGAVGGRARGGEEVVEQRRVVERAVSPRRWNSGCHCTAAT